MPLKTGTYTIRNEGTKLYLDLLDANPTPGNKIIGFHQDFTLAQEVSFCRFDL